MSRFADALHSERMTPEQFVDAVLGERLDLAKFLRRHGMTQAELDAWLAETRRELRAGSEHHALEARRAEVVLHWWRLLIEQDAAWRQRTEGEVLAYLETTGAAQRLPDGAWLVTNPAVERMNH